MERFGGIFLVAGLAFFIFAFVAMGAQLQRRPLDHSAKVDERKAA